MSATKHSKRTTGEEQTARAALAGRNTENPAENEGFASKSRVFTAAVNVDAEAESSGIPERNLASANAGADDGAGQNAADSILNPEESSPVRRVGRPVGLDPAARRKVCLLLTAGFPRPLAAAEVGVDRSTLNRTMKRDPAFHRQVLEAEKLFERGPLLTVVQAARKNWRAATWLLNHYQPESVRRRKVKAELKRSGRENKAWFKMAADSMRMSSPNAGDANPPPSRKTPRRKRAKK